MAPTSGRTKPGDRTGASGLAGRRRSQTADDITTMAVGQAIPLKTTPTCEDPQVFENKLNVSPTTLRPIPVARRIQGPFRFPESKAVAPTTRPSSSRSPIG